MIREGDVLRFDADGLQRLEAVGLGEPEPGGTWTVASRVTLRVPVDASCEGLLLHLAFTPYVTPIHGQVVHVRLGDQASRRLEYPPGHATAAAVSLRMDGDWIEQSKCLVVEVPTALSPAVLEGSLDERSLGIQLHSLEVRQPPEISEPGPVSTGSRRRLSRLRRRPGDARSDNLAQILQSTQSTHLAISRLAERVGELERAFRDVRRHADALSDLHGPVQAIRTDVGAMHHKADELLVRSDALLSRSDIAIPMADDAFLVRSSRGFVVCPKEDLVLLSSLLSTGVLEPGLTSFLERLLQPGWGFIDAGAHVGLLTVPAARRVGTGGHVLAVEATPRTARMLTMTLRANGLADWVRVEQVALGDHEGEVTLFVDSICGHNSLYPLGDSGPSVRVPLRRLDDLVAPETRVDVIKLDVEGAELDVLQGMPRLMSENPDLVIIAEFGPTHLERTRVEQSRWLDTFLAGDRRGYAVLEPSGAVVRIEQVSLAEAFSINLVFVSADSRHYDAIRSMVGQLA